MRLLCALFALLAVACADEVVTLQRTQVTLRVSAVDEVRARMATLRVRVRVDGGEPAVRSFARGQLASWPVDLHVIPSSADNDSTALLEVIAEAVDETDTVLVQQRVRSAFLPRAKRVLPLVLARCGAQPLPYVCGDPACTGETCLTCLEDSCRPAPYVDPTQLAELGPTSGAGGGATDTPITVSGGPSVPSATGAPVRTDCAMPGTEIRCDDQLICNGLERCEPADPAADARGCVRGEPLACRMGETCIEQMRGCSVCSLAPDADGDGVASRTCGGNDCDDSDPARFPGNPERCDAKDNDCNALVDDGDAPRSCAMPAGGSAMCGARGTCEARCDDPDFDVVGGACMRHDDCAGVTACGPGKCVDGVRGFTCECASGFTGSGTRACVDVDECAANVLGCDVSPRACVNQLGSASCQCPPTHFGSGAGASGCIQKATKVSVGNGYTCAVLVGGGVKCWGGGAFFRLGTGDQRTRGELPGQLGDALPLVDLGAGKTASSVVAGADLTCAILNDRTVRCWGYDGYGGVTGAGARDRPWTGAMGEGLPPVALPAGLTPTALSAGGGYGLALLSDGTLAKWGPTVSVFSAGAGNRARAFERSTAYDGAHHCAVLDTGGVVCWGALLRDRGQLGGPAPLGPVDGYVPVALGTGKRATAVALGDLHTCALLDDGGVKCWGDNTFGQLGLGDTRPRGLVAGELGDALPVVPLGRPARAIAAGRNHSCALLDDGTVRCWGLNDYGQLGRGLAGNVGAAPGEIAALRPVDLGPGRTAVAIEAGSHTCALLDHGGIKCWGPNESGQLGQGNTTPIGAAGGMGAALREVDLGGG